MKLKILVAAMLAGGLVSGASASASASKRDFSAMKREMALARAEVNALTAAEVGDADSFGRNAKYIGLMSSGGITLAQDCTPDPDFPPGPDDHCVLLNPQPAVTTFNIPDVARMVIPAKSSNSIFCHMQTPVSVTQLRNNTTATITGARIVITPTYTFENPVLNDPSLIDPSTGLPFGGSLRTSLAGIRHQLTLQPNELFVGRDSNTRSCLAGMISKRQLIGYGLSEAQATEFFKKDTIITMGLTGSAQGVEFSSTVYGVRWLGD